MLDVPRLAVTVCLGSCFVALGCAGGTSGSRFDSPTDGSLGDGGEDGTPFRGEAGNGGTVEAGNGGTDRDAGSQDASCGELTLLIRDFSSSHVDFQVYSGTAASTGILAARLDDSGKPVLTGEHVGGEDPQVTSEDSFAEWYEDVPNVNVRREVQLALDEVSPGRFVFDSALASNPFGGVSGFFPIDDLPGAELTAVQNLEPDPGATQRHNFHFTTEVHASFTYRGGEVFSFSGDDDLWIFANGQLVLDLGGLHPRLEGTVDFDQLAGELGLTVGETYSLDVFHAERHTHESNFRIETTIECFLPPNFI